MMVKQNQITDTKSPIYAPAFGSFSIWKNNNDRRGVNIHNDGVPLERKVTTGGNSALVNSPHLLSHC